jgi:hypothetical protein
MLKKVLGIFSILLFCTSFIYAGRIYIIDTPSIYLVDYTSCVTNIKYFSYGSMVFSSGFGVARFFSLGLSWEVDSLIGNIKPRLGIPMIDARFCIFSGNMNGAPGFSVGYSGQGTFVGSYNDYYNWFVQRGKGVYGVLGGECAKDFLYSFGINFNDFRMFDVLMFLNFKKTFGKKESFALDFEIDNINVKHFSDTRLNAGLEVSITENLIILFGFRDILGDNVVGRVPIERIVHIQHCTKF